MKPSWRALKTNAERNLRQTFLSPHPRFTFHLDPTFVVRRWGAGIGGCTSLAVLDDQVLLVVGVQKFGSTPAEVLILLQRVPSGWKCWPLLALDAEKEGVVLRCFRSVWGSATEAKPGGVAQHSCWIWELCSSRSVWEDRQWKLSCDLSVRPV